jgi:hypothetical protein
MIDAQLARELIAEFERVQAHTDVLARARGRVLVRDDRGARSRLASMLTLLHGGASRRSSKAA